MNHWISVDTVWPDHGEQVLVTDGKSVWMIRFLTPGGFTHWMACPRPPEPEIPPGTFYTSKVEGPDGNYRVGFRARDKVDFFSPPVASLDSVKAIVKWLNFVFSEWRRYNASLQGHTHR